MIIKKISSALAVLLLSASALFADGITVNAMEKGSYSPTQIVNGDFDVCPFQSIKLNGTWYTSLNSSITKGGQNPSEIKFNGVGEGWNSTDVTIFPGGKLYDWCKGYWSSGSRVFVDFSVNACYQDYVQGSSYSSWSFIEMNGYNPSIFYQDLATVPGDVIRWTLNHARRYSTTETIHVEIGAPKRDSNNNIINATGIKTNKTTNIQDDGKAIFRYTGVTDSAGNTSSLGSGTSAQLKYLRLLSSDTKDWHEASGVYVVPEKQTVSRFAFISDAPNTADGNLLDSITFNTLIGNLSGEANYDGSVTVYGYWGDVAGKSLMIQIGDGTPIEVPMTLTDSDFKIEIPAEMVNGVYQVTVYHKDYQNAKRVIHIHKWVYSTEGSTIKAHCESTASVTCEYMGEENEVSVRLRENNGDNLEAIFTYANASDKNATWTNSNSSKLQLDDDGHILALEETEEGQPVRIKILADDGSGKQANVDVTIKSAERPVYSIETTLYANMKAYKSNRTTVPEGGTVVLRFEAETNYTLPKTATVTNVNSYTWDSSTGKLTLKYPTGNVAVSFSN